MNYRIIRYICGHVLLFEAGFMALSLLVAVIYREARSALVFSGLIVFLALVGLLLRHRKPDNLSFYAREGVITVSLSWVLISVFGALPFLFTGAIPHVVDSLFESVSGFTTTGASILSDVETMDRSLLFWRSFTHWIGGMGVLIFIMALLPMSKADPYHIMRAESPGPTTEKLVPKTKHTANILYRIYIGLTILEVIFLVSGGMPLYDSLVHTFGTAGTGGFSMRNASIGAYGNLYYEVVITVFMVLFGINFSAFYLLLARQFKDFLRFRELRVYLGILVAAMLAVAVNITGSVYHSFGESLRYATFQVASIMTTTGFSTANFDVWPMFSKIMLYGLMFIGACAGSTGGGIKVSRYIIVLKALYREALRILHPRAVKMIRIENTAIQEDVIKGTATFFFAVVCISAGSVLLVSLNGFSMETTVSSVAACINNIGPGFDVVSPIGNYSSFSPFSKVVLLLNMLVGRLEVYPILMLFLPTTWFRRMK